MTGKMKKPTILCLAIVVIFLPVIIGCSGPTPTPGKSHLLMARILHDDSVSIKAGETKSLDVTLETRKSGPGRVIYEISGAPDGLDVSIEPSQFMAQPETVYHSTITIKASSGLPPGEYRHPPEAKECLVNWRSFDRLLLKRVSIQYSTSKSGYLQPIYVFEGEAHQKNNPNAESFIGRVDAVAR